GARSRTCAPARTAAPAGCPRRRSSCSSLRRQLYSEYGKADIRIYGSEFHGTRGRPRRQIHPRNRLDRYTGPLVGDRVREGGQGMTVATRRLRWLRGAATAAAATIALVACGGGGGTPAGPSGLLRPAYSAVKGTNGGQLVFSGWQQVTD